MQINSTELAGLAAFVPAVFACALATGRAPTRRRKSWTWLALIHALLAMEIVLSLRHLLDRRLAGLLRVAHVYPERRPAQAAVILLLLAVGALAALYIMRRTPAGALRTATGATIAAFALFVVESVSLHAVDAIFYRTVGPIMLIGWLWLACGWTVAGAAMLPRRR